MIFIPREEQKEVLEYRSGTMGISAVPGAGKTATLSALAADLVEEITKENGADSYSDPEHEVLIVTYSNAAEMNFSTRIASILSDRGLVPGYGYKVRTLHGMALELLRGHAQQIGLPEDFAVLDDVEANNLLVQAVALWLRDDGGKTFDMIADPMLTQDQKDEYKAKFWKNDLAKILGNVISKVKDYHLSPADLREKADLVEDPFGRSLLEMTCGVYEYYQEMLKNFPGMDFPDLMRNAYLLLTTDKEYLEYLQNHYKYILEDEAQDSTLIQEDVLRLLSGKHGNWVRVGDPNQAINETFTTASPDYLKEFLSKADKKVDLKTAGRSQLSIIRQANRLVRYVSEKHKNEECRDALTPPYIFPTLAGDAQKNPAEDPSRVVYDINLYTPNDEIDVVCREAVSHVQSHPSETTVILAPTNDIGKLIAERLSDFPVETIEFLKSTSKARSTAMNIAAVLKWLAKPLSSENLKELFCQLYNEKASGDFYLTAEDSTLAVSILLSLEEPETFFYPEDKELFEKMVSEWDLNEILVMTLFRFRYFLSHWLSSRFLPIDQLVLLIAQDLYENPDDLCCAGQIGFQLLMLNRANPEYTLADLAEKANYIANKSQLVAGLRGIEIEFDPNRYPGKIVVTTYHKAKGLEWDQVYAMGVNNFSFPDGMPDQYNRRYFTGKKYVRERLDLQEEILYALKTAVYPEKGIAYKKGLGSREAWNNYAKERCRLLYVGITRAKKGLHVTGNGGMYGRNEFPMTLEYLQNEWYSGKSNFNAQNKPISN